MSSTRDPILLLEPSNLLEPLNLADRSDAPASALARPERPDTSSKRFMRPSKSTTAPIDRDRRWRLKSALIVAGALACFAAGTALPQLPELAFSDVRSARQKVAEPTKRPVTAADTSVKSEQPKPAEPKQNESTPNGSHQSIALTTNPGPQSTASAPGQSAPVDQPAAPAQATAATGGTSCRGGSDSCLEGGAPDPTRTPASDRKSDGSNSDGSPRTTVLRAGTTARETEGAQPIDPQRTDIRTPGRQEERGQSAVPSRRAGQRDRDLANPQPAADDNSPAVKSADRNSWDRRPDQDSNRTSSRRRDRSAGDNGQTLRYGESRPEQEVSRSSSWRRDRNDEYARGEDRRVFGSRPPREDDRVVGFGRPPRDDDRVFGGGPRHEGPMPIFPSLFGW